MLRSNFSEFWVVISKTIFHFGNELTIAYTCTISIFHSKMLRISFDWFYRQSINRNFINLANWLNCANSHCLKNWDFKAPFIIMLFWFQLNPKLSPKVNWCTNKSRVKYLSINTCEDSSVGKAWDSNKRATKVLISQLMQIKSRNPSYWSHIF